MKKTLSILLLSLACSTYSFSQIQGWNIGEPAPSFTLTDLHGNSHTLSDYEGKYIVLDLFAYWCGPCQSTALVINQFYKKYGCNSGDMIVLAFDADGTDAQTQEFEDNFGGDSLFPTPTVSGIEGEASDIVDDYNPEAYPTICLIDDEGNFANLDVWPVSSPGDLESAVSAAGGSAVLIEQDCESSNVSVPEIHQVKTIVFPNPAKDELNILSNTLGKGTVTLTDILGKIVYTSNSSDMVKLKIDVSNFDSGKYILSIKSEYGIESQLITVL